VIKISIKYFKDEEVSKLINSINKYLGFNFPTERIIGIKSYGSKSKKILARCWAMSKIFKLAGLEIHYAIEVIGERWDNLSLDEKEKIIIHELLHIPFSFGGGLKPHKGWVTNKRVNKLWLEYKKSKLRS